MVALASPPAADITHGSRRDTPWSWRLATGAVLLLGVGLRLAVHPGGVGDRSAAVMLALLGVSAWAAASVLLSPRSAFVVTLALVVLLNLAALTPRATTEYDDRQAFYQTDQQLAAHVSSAPSAFLNDQASPALTLLVEPIFAGTQPQFGLAGDVRGAPLAWNCAFKHGLQQLALAVPRAALAGSETVDVRLRLTGSPTRESDYLLVYASSARGGFLVSLVAAADVAPGGTICALR